MLPRSKVSKNTKQAKCPKRCRRWYLSALPVIYLTFTFTDVKLNTGKGKHIYVDRVLVKPLSPHLTTFSSESTQTPVFCQPSHLRFARKHANKQAPEGWAKFSHDDVISLFNRTQKNKDLSKKFVLFHVGSNNVTDIEGLNTADDFTRNCALQLLKTFKILRASVFLPELYFIFCSLAALEQADIFGSISHVPVFSACSGHSPSMRRLFFPRATSVLSPARFFGNVSDFRSKEPKLFFRGALSGPEREVLFRDYQGNTPTMDIAMSKVPGGAPCDLNRRSWCSGIPEKWVKRSGLQVKKTAHVPLKDSLNRFRYVLSVDGVGCADRLATLLSAPNLVFKVESEYVEFWYEDLMPYEHYIPVKHNLSNLQEVVLWANQQTEATLLNIISKANSYVENYLSTEALLCYYTQIIEIYIQLMYSP